MQNLQVWRVVYIYVCINTSENSNDLAYYVKKSSWFSYRYNSYKFTINQSNINILHFDEQLSNIKSKKLMGRHLLIRWMVLLPQLLHLSVSKLLLIARMREGSASILFLFFNFIEISTAWMWLHEYADENGRCFVIAMPINSLDAFWVIFEKVIEFSLLKIVFHELSAGNSIKSSNFVKQIIGNHLTCKKIYLLVKSIYLLSY